MVNFKQSPADTKSCASADLAKRPSKAALGGLLVEPTNESRLRELIETDKRLILPLIEQYCNLANDALKDAGDARNGRGSFDADKLYRTYHVITNEFSSIGKDALFESIWECSLSHALGHSIENICRFAEGRIELHQIPGLDIPPDAVISFIRGNDRKQGTFKPDDFLDILDRVCLPHDFILLRSPGAWRCEISSLRIEVIGVGNIIEAVMSQLILNAKDAVEQKNPDIKWSDKEKHIFLSERLLENGDLEIRVRDKGIGILDENLPRIFDDGFSTKGERRGKGLTSIRKLMEIISGSICVESVYGEGTTVTLTIPCRFVETPA